MSLPITSDGSAVITTFTGQRYIVGISGDFGGGSMAVNWLDDDGDATPYNGSPLTEGGAIGIDAASPRLQLVLTGSTSPTLEAVVDLVSRSSNFGGFESVAISSEDYAALSAVEQHNGTIYYLFD